MSRKSKVKGKKKTKVVRKQQVTFDLFFAECVRKGELKSWQSKEILAFFKDNKLKLKEDIEVYRKMLKKY